MAKLKDMEIPSRLTGKVNVVNHTAGLEFSLGPPVAELLQRIPQEGTTLEGIARMYHNLNDAEIRKRQNWLSKVLCMRGLVEVTGPGQLYQRTQQADQADYTFVPGGEEESNFMLRSNVGYRRPKYE